MHDFDEGVKLIYNCRAALLAAQVLPNIAKGDAYKQFEWVLLESHATLLEILMKNSGNEKLITQRCQRLSSLIFHSTLPMNEQLLTLQEKVGYLERYIVSQRKLKEISEFIP